MKGNADAQMKVLGADGVSKFVTEAMLGGSTAAQGPSGTHDFAKDGALLVTVPSATVVPVTLQGVALPRTLYYTIDSGNSILTEVQAREGGAWRPANFGAAGVLTSASTDLVHSLDGRVNALRFSRTAGSGTTSTVEIA